MMTHPQTPMELKVEPTTLPQPGQAGKLVDTPWNNKYREIQRQEKPS